MKKNRLLLHTKNDVPFIEAQVNIHQPTIDEISLIGEDNFQVGVRFIGITKDEIEDKTGLDDKTDFDIFMSIIRTKEGMFYKVKVMMVLTLLFPNFQIAIYEDRISLMQEKEEKAKIDKENFDAFKEIINNIFPFKSGEGGKSEYNPADKRAQKIAEKLAKGKKKAAKSKGQNLEDISIFTYYISVLSVGLQKDKNVLLQYTVPQLLDEFDRYQRKISYDAYVSAKMAGAKDIDEVQHWMNDVDK